MGQIISIAYARNASKHSPLPLCTKVMYQEQHRKGRSAMKRVGTEEDGEKARIVSFLPLPCPPAPSECTHTSSAYMTNSTISIPVETRKRLTATSEGEDEIEPAAISNDDECFFLSSGGADNKMMEITGHCCSLSHPLTHHESLTWCNVV